MWLHARNVSIVSNIGISIAMKLNQFHKNALELLLSQWLNRKLYVQRYTQAYKTKIYMDNRENTQTEEGTFRHLHLHTNTHTCTVHTHIHEWRTQTQQQQQQQQ